MFARRLRFSQGRRETESNSQMGLSGFIGHTRTGKQVHPEAKELLIRKHKIRDE
jgi:hypothetical protein